MLQQESAQFPPNNNIIIIIIDNNNMIIIVTECILPLHSAKFEAFLLAKEPSPSVRCSFSGRSGPSSVPLLSEEDSLGHRNASSSAEQDVRLHANKRILVAQVQKLCDTGM